MTQMTYEIIDLCVEVTDKSPMSNVYSEVNFEEDVILASKPVLVDFWSETCHPCKVLAPMIDELANLMEGKAHVGKVNVSENQQLAAKYGIRVVPSMLFFKNGEVKELITGANVTLEKLQAMLESLV